MRSHAFPLLALVAVALALPNYQQKPPAPYPETPEKQCPHIVCFDGISSCGPDGKPPPPGSHDKPAPPPGPDGKPGPAPGPDEKPPPPPGPHDKPEPPYKQPPPPPYDEDSCEEDEYETY
ncbi:hypothetical protein JX266_005582 [Neoarthrinium moseri]|nr:hypothetical protein JX266_005582 [Neoarthrinium moseri]